MPSHPRACITSVLAVALLAALASGAARAQVKPEVAISAGKQGGYYSEVAERLRSVLTAEYNTFADVRPSPGSIENLKRLHDSKSSVNVAIAQADALMQYVADHPKFSEQYVLLGDIGKECVFLIAGANGGIESVADLKSDSGRSLSVDDENSGAAVTWAYMNRLEPAFASTEATGIGVMEALLQIKVGGEFSQTRAAMLVQRPETVSPAIQVVLDNSEVYQVVPIRSGDLKSTTIPGVGPTYTFETVSVGPLSFETICTRGLLLGSGTKLPKDVRNRLAEAMLNASDRILPAEK